MMVRRITEKMSHADLLSPSCSKSMNSVRLLRCGQKVRLRSSQSSAPERLPVSKSVHYIKDMEVYHGC